MTSERLEFVRLTPSHFSKLAALFEVIRTDTAGEFFHPHPFSDEEAKKICTHTGKDKYYGAVANHVIVGYGMLRGWDDGFSIPSLGIYIISSWRGTGVARGLMEFLHASARLSGATQIRLKVYSTNSPALSLYRALGYIFTPTAIGGQLCGTFDL